MSAECFCDRCNGYGPTCEVGDHRYGPWTQKYNKNATCLDCGELNGPYFSWIGNCARRAKKNGWSFEDQAQWEEMLGEEWIEGIGAAGSSVVTALMARAAWQ